MWLLILAGLLAVSAGKETVSNAAEKAEASSSNADDIVMLEIDVKEQPTKRSPVQATAGYRSSQNQYLIGHGDEAQQLSPDYLALTQQYGHAQADAYGPSSVPPVSQRRPISAYAKEQQQLQQAYHNFRRPTVVPPRPRLQLHPQALAQAEAGAQMQAHQEARDRAAALQLARHGSASTSPSYQVASYSPPKLGTFEQELLQLVSANQAQEFKLVSTQPKQPLGKIEYSPYSQQLVSYAKPEAAVAPHGQLPEQYHIETTATQPRYHQPQAVAATYQSAEEPVHVQYQSIQSTGKEFRPSPQYPNHDESAHLKAIQAQAEAEAIARAQAHAEAQALSYHKFAQNELIKHQNRALDYVQLNNEHQRQHNALEQLRLANEAAAADHGSALEQIQKGAHVSEAGKHHIEELTPKDPQSAYKAHLKVQLQTEIAEARRAQNAADQKKHSDAILKLQAQQQAHLKAQDDAHKFALAFEGNQIRAQAQAQLIAQAQAEALYKIHQAKRLKAHARIHQIAGIKTAVSKNDLLPVNGPVNYYGPEMHPSIISPNKYFLNDQVNKYQASGSSYVTRSAPKPGPTTAVDENAFTQQIITQPRRAEKLKIPANSQSSVYVSESGLLKKSPVKSLTVEEIIQQDQINSPHDVHIPTSKNQPALTEEELSALVNAGYSVTPVPQAAKPTEQSYFENSSSGYYLKKQRNPVSSPEYVTYDEILQRRPHKKNKSLLKQDDDGSEKITYLVPLEPSFGTRQATRRSHE